MKSKKERYDGNLDHFIRDLYYRTSRRAKKRHLEFDLTIESLYKLYKNQQGKCDITDRKLALERGNLFRIAVTRKDPNKGYLINNVVLVGSFVAKMKQDYSDHLFIQLCQIVSSQYTNEEIE